MRRRRTPLSEDNAGVTVGVRFTPAAQGLIRRLRERYPDLHLLLDDTGCCGPSNVFLQDHPPFPVYESLGRINGVTVSIHPTFARGAGQAFVVDTYPSEADDSFSLETSLGHRLTLGFETAKGGESGTSAEVA